MSIETEYKRLLSRKRYNGKDLGKTVIYSVAYKNYCSQSGKAAKLPYFTNDELIARAESLTDSQRLECNKYIRFSSAVKICLSFSKEIYTRLMKDYYYIQLNLKGIADCNIEYTRAALQPLIVTSKTAKDLKGAAAKLRATASLNYADLFFLALEYFIMLEAQPLLLPAEIREELDQLQQQPILDQPGQEAAKRKITNDDRAAAARLIFEGKAAILEKLEACNYVDIDLVKTLDESELIDHINQLGGVEFLADPDANIAKSAAGIKTKYNALRTYITSYQAYKGTAIYNKAAKRILTNFKKEYSTLYRLINDYIQERIPTLAGIKLNQVTKAICTASDISRDFEPIRTVLSTDPAPADYIRLLDIHDPREQLMANQLAAGGLAIASQVSPTAITCYQLGIYDHTAKLMDWADSIEQYKAPKLQRITKLNVDDIANIITYMEATDTYLAAMLQALELTPLYEALATNIDTMKRTLETHNKAVYLAYSGIHGTPEQRQEHRKLFKETFRPLFLTAWDPFKQDTIAAKTMFEAAINQPREIIIELASDPKQFIEGIRVMLDDERKTKGKANE